MHSHLHTAARQDIEDLRRLYGRATDLFGRGGEDDIAHAREIYARIFTADADIRVTDGDEITLTATGPDGWADVVLDALDPYAVTQHLIGTQLVDIDMLDTNAAGQLVDGAARMSSYLHAWHATAQGRVWIVVGTYHDQVRYVPRIGWQIHDMTLESLSSDERMLGGRGSAD